MSKERKNKVNPWLVVGVIVLIVLLFGWLTFADMAGDTDVSTESNFADDNLPAPEAVQTDAETPQQQVAELPVTATEIQTTEISE